LQTLLPPGGSRNGLDCALWDLEAKQTSGGIAALTGIAMAPLHTLFTLSLDDPDAMARRAYEVPQLSRLKLKLNAQEPLDCLQAIREARPDAQLVIDANGSWTPEVMMAMGDGLARFEVALLEQPLPHGDDGALENLRYPVPLCADESCQSSADLEAVADRCADHTRMVPASRQADHGGQYAGLIISHGTRLGGGPRRRFCRPRWTLMAAG
jgi:L-alanine-DL-glutamate epimerase-like enolase superfamily enzyme